MNRPILLALLFAMLLGIEWRYRLRSARLAAAMLAVAAWLFVQPTPPRAAREVMWAPPAARVTRMRPVDGPLSEYQSGVATMERAVEDNIRMGEDTRVLCVGVLFWLACSPAFRTARGPSAAEQSDHQQGTSPI